ncbi:MAG: hypothetical protein L0H83_09535 [Salinisphaera sp.]|nr:hypothetical protein [Salinisphaera sp.]
MKRSTFRIAADHPCLPGHFPGDPIVPAVIVLERVIEAIAADSGHRVVGIPRCKFTRPLRPDQWCTVEWTAQADAMRFTCSNAGGTVARGLLQVADG